MPDPPGVGLRTLPRSLDPLEDESLRGYLLRLAHRYGASPSEIAAHEAMAPIIDGAKSRDFSVGYQFRSLSGTSHPLRVVLRTSRQDKSAFQRMGQRIEDQGLSRISAGLIGDLG
jgi:hypothetical protein